MAKPQGRFGGACGIRLFLLFALQQFPCQQAQEILLRTKPIQGRHGGIVMLLCQRTCPVQAVEGDKGRFVVIGIAADGLAQLFGGRGHIEDVVHDLEHKAHFGRILHKSLAQGGRGIGSRTAQFHRYDDECTGLVAVQF